MKIKQILSALICTALVSALSVQSVSAGEPVTVTEEEEVVSESSELVSEDDILDDSNIISCEVVNGVTRTAHTFNWTVKAGATVTGSFQTTLHAGDYYYFNIGNTEQLTADAFAAHLLADFPSYCTKTP